ncbi:MAG: beta-N-acetylhexosaminidase [Victivallaceae bacterium]|nr:beta-N-acetylhexosaminidase [Victivallaceae bacterium]
MDDKAFMADGAAGEAPIIMLDDFSSYDSAASVKAAYRGGAAEMKTAIVKSVDYDGCRAMRIESTRSGMAAAVCRRFDNALGAAAAGVTVAAADPGVLLRNGVLELAVRAELDGPDLARLTVEDAGRVFGDYFLLCPELAALKFFWVVFKVGRRNLIEHEYNYKLHEIYGGNPVSSTVGHRAVFVVSGLRLVSAPAAVGVIPRPNRVVCGGGCYVLSPRSAIVAYGEGGMRRIAGMLREMLSASTGYTLPVVAPDAAAGFVRPITFELNNAWQETLGSEGYRVVAAPGGVALSAASDAGLFYAVQTLRQLFAPEIDRGFSRFGERWAIPAVEIEDVPAYGWRGMHLDTARHYMPKKFLLRFIDMLATLKMNRFHWHYNDGTAWRIAIESMPELTASGAWWGGEQGGFYTAADVAEIVSYARDRFIQVVPEVEMPAHANALLFSHPECSCQKFTVPEGEVDTPEYFIKPRWISYCPSCEKTYEFIDRLIAANVTMFPDNEFIHLGGDELPPGSWENCPECRKFMAEHHMASEAELQRYFTARLIRIAAAHGRRLLGWEQILHDGLPEDAAVIAYYTAETAANAAGSGHQVVNNDATTNYLDYYQGDPLDEPVAIQGVSTLEKSYSFDPVANVPPELRFRVLGGQSALWTEYVPGERQAGYQLYPRGVAIAEKVWTQPGLCRWADFERLMNGFYRRLEYAGLNFKDYRENRGSGKK